MEQQLRPFQSDPLYLGGLPRGDTDNNKIDRDSTYGMLRRAATLPRCAFSTAGSITTVLNKLWDGDCQVHVHVDDGGFAVLVSPNIEDERGSEDSVLLYCQFFFTMEGGRWTFTFPDPPRDGVSRRFRNALTGEQHLALVVRVFHQLLRTRGVDYPYTTYPHLYERLLEHYMLDQQYRLALDLLLVKFDSLMNQRQVPLPTIASELWEVGEMLESRGKFYEAAKVYQETVETFFTHDTDARPPEFDRNFPPGLWNGSEFAQVWSYAGLAYKRADKFEESEAANVKALYYYRIYRGGGRFDVHDTFVSTAFINMHLLYDSWINQPDTDEIFPILWAFLVVIRNQGFSRFPAGDEILDFMSRLKIRREFKTSKGAGRLFERALRSPSVSEYRRELLSVFQEGFSSRLVRPPVAPALPSASDSRKLQKKAARLVAGQVNCSNPVCMTITDTPKRCPCGQVAYCHKDCQVAHWSEHKMACPHRRPAASQ